MKSQVILQEVRHLAGYSGFPCVSLMIPTPSLGRTRMEMPLRLKQMIASAEQQLLETGCSRPLASDIVATLQQKCRDKDWTHGTSSWAIYVSPSHAAELPITGEVPELAIVGDRFQVLPLLPLLTSQPFYILQLDLHDLRFYRADQLDIQELAVPELPRTLEDLIPSREQKASQAHVAGPSSRAGSYITHGSTALQDVVKEHIKQLCHAVDRAIAPIIGSGKSDLVLAGVDSVTNVFRHVSHLNTLACEVRGSSKALSLDGLHSAALACIAEEQTVRRRRELKLCQHELGTGKASAQIEECVLAAGQGRVRSIFIMKGAAMWGRIDLDAQKVHCSPQRSATDQELINYAAVQTYLDGGRIYECSEEEMPSQSVIAAIFRF